MIFGTVLPVRFFVHSFVVTEDVITYVRGTFHVWIVTAWHAHPTSLLIGFPCTLITAHKPLFWLPVCIKLM